MKLLLQISLCGLLACGVGLAQRGGGGHGGGGGGFHGGGGMGGGFRGGGGFGGGGFRGGGGFGGGGFRGGYGGYGGFRGGYGGYGGFGRGYGGWGRGWGGYGGWGYGGWGWGWPGWGLGLGWGWPAWDWDMGWDYYDPYLYNYPAYAPAPYGYYNDPPAMTYSPGATVIYPQAQPVSTAVYVQPPVRPVTHVYDEYGQEVDSAPAVRGASSPIYLIAFKDQVIHAATSYRFEGNTLVYETMQHEEKRAPLSSLDGNFTLQLNRERHVPFNLPQP